MAERIPQYTAPALGLEPSERGIDALQQAARRVGAFYSQSAEDISQTGRAVTSAIETAGNAALKFEEHREISAGAKNFAELQDNLTRQWNETAKNADPNDPAVAAKFRETVLEPSLEKFSEQGFLTDNGQRWAQGHAAALREHLYQKTAADMSTLAGEAVKTNYATTINKLSSTVRLDPSNLDFALKTAESSLGAIADSSPTLSVADAGRVKTEGLLKARESIVKSAVIGMIEKNPNIDLGAIESKYGQYISGPEMQMFQKAAKAQARADLLTQKQIETYNRQQADQAVHAGANKVFTDNVAIDPATGRVTINPNFFRQSLDLARNNPNAPNAAPTAKAWIDWGEAQQRQRAEPVVSDPATKSNLLTGMFDPNKPTTIRDVLVAEAQDKISTRDGAILRQLVNDTGPEAIKDPLVHTAIQAASERVGVGLVGDGHERYANFMQAFWPQYLAQKRAGTLPANALDLKDENSLIRQSLKAYEPPAADRMMMHQLKLLGIQNIDQITKAGTGTQPTPAAALPPIDKREKGKTYPTPRGDMKWTGTGWVTP